MTVYEKPPSGGGGGGGGACPFLYTYNGKWEAQNNILVWSENATRRNLETKDYYLFNGNENDGRITIGIGESGNDVDYFDSVKLYKVNVPQGYEVAESYRGKVYAYRDVETGIMKDNTGKNVTSLIGKEDNHYWIGDKGSYVDVTLNLSKRNLLLIRGIDNPPVEKNNVLFRPPVTLSTIWIYANKSGKWSKIAEIKVRHNLHTNVMDLSHYIHQHRGKVELRFLMKDRNGLDFIGISHHYKKVHLHRVKLLNSNHRYDDIAKVDGQHLRINPNDFITLHFRGRGNGMYLLKVYGFYFNKDKIGKGIGIVRENVTNIAEAPLTNSTHSEGNYVLLPLLENYSGISSIIWFVDGYYLPGEKPVISFESGEHHIELWVIYNSGAEEHYSLYTFSS